MSNLFTFERDLKPITKGEVVLPNFEPMDAAVFLNNLAAIGHSWQSVWGYAKHEAERKNWAMFFLSGAGMGSPPHTYGGGGYVVIWGNQGPKVGTFAICRHEFRMGAGANPSRGWRPGSCAKCGLDMSVDSGD